MRNPKRVTELRLSALKKQCEKNDAGLLVAIFAANAKSRNTTSGQLGRHRPSACRPAWNEGLRSKLSDRREVPLAIYLAAI